MAISLQCTPVFAKNWHFFNKLEKESDNGLRYIINEGSSRSSKTTSILDCIDFFARKIPNLRITCWRDTKEVARRTFFEDLIKHHTLTGRYLKGYRHIKQPTHFLYKNGSKIEVQGADDAEAVHGLNQDIAFINEPYQIAEEVFNQIDQRTTMGVVVDWNPKKNHWIEKIKLSKRAITLHSTFNDNPFCPPNERAKILSYQPIKLASVVLNKQLSEAEAYTYDVFKNELNLKEKELGELSRCLENERIGSADKFNWEVYGLGIKSELPQRIYRHFQEISLFEFENIDSPIYYGVDWGSVDPFAVLAVKYYDGAFYVHELNYDSENELRQKMDANLRAYLSSEEEGIVGWLFEKLKIRKDYYQICDNNRPSKIIKLRQSGYDFALSIQKPSIIDRIDLVNSMKVFYTNTSKNFEKESELYCRKVDRYGIVLEQPEDKHNHLMDAFGYVAEFLRQSNIINVI